MSSVSRKLTQHNSLRPQWKQLPEYFSWLPDWTEEENYKFHAYPATRWAWEFLRRNIEYAQASQAIHSVVEKHQGLLYLCKKTRINRLENGRLEVVYADKAVKFFDPLIKKIAQKFSVFSFPPAVSEFNPNIQFEPIALPEECRRLRAQVQGCIPRFHAHLLRGQIDMPTVRKIQRLLSSIEENAVFLDKRQRQKSYRESLRILDAIYSDASNLEIAKIMYPKHDYQDADVRIKAHRKIQEKFKRALELRDREYKIIGQRGNKLALMSTMSTVVR